jgi:hypothetical protein
VDKPYFTNSDHFVSPYLRRRLRPLAEVLTADERPELRAVHIKAELTPNHGVDGLAAAASPAENERDGQNRAD